MHQQYKKHERTPQVAKENIVQQKSNRKIFYSKIKSRCLCGHAKRSILMVSKYGFANSHKKKYGFATVRMNALTNLIQINHQRIE